MKKNLNAHWGEFDLIRHYFCRPSRHREVCVGIGDDGAVFTPGRQAHTVISCDTLVDRIHFDTHITPHALGWKSLAVSISDIVAMGAEPHYALLSLGIPHQDSAWLSAFRSGFFDCADHYAVDLIGGDTVCSPICQLTTTVIGQLFEQAVLRSGACAGDDIWVTGCLGLPALALLHQQGSLSLSEQAYGDCLSALSYPTPPLSLMRLVASCLSASIDISDGFLQDLSHLLVLATSPLKAVCDMSWPWLAEVDTMPARQAVLWGGDDYQLLFVASPQYRAFIQQKADEAGVVCQRIGYMAERVSEDGYAEVNGQTFSLSDCRQGFVHFA